MNDSNNNFGDNNVYQQPSNPTEVSQTSEANSWFGVNQTQISAPTPLNPEMQSQVDVMPSIDNQNVLANPIIDNNFQQSGDLVQVNQTSIVEQASINQNIQQQTDVMPPIGSQNIVANPMVNNEPLQPNVSNAVDQMPLNSQQMVQNDQMLESQLNVSPSTSVDDELLKVFIGENYDKITTRPFNFAAFFLTTLYMFYRKMFVYASLTFLISLIAVNVINNFVVLLILNVLLGFLFNKLYLSYAKKKIAIIKATNSGKSIEELKAICITKGGTSVGKVFLGLFVEIVIALAVLFIMMLAGIGSFIGDFFDLSKWNITIINKDDKISDDDTGNNSSSEGSILVENVSVMGHSCIASKCEYSLYDGSGQSTKYVLEVSNDLFNVLDEYQEYIKLNIYYKQNGDDKAIVDYKIFRKSDNEELIGVKTEDELRNKLGLYSLGTHTDTLTLRKVGDIGFGFNDDNAYTYIKYTFVSSNGIEYEMKYIGNDLNLTVGNIYTVTFEVTEGFFEYEFTIKSVK